MPDLTAFDLDRIHTDIAQVEELILRTEYLLQEEQDADMKLLLQDQLVACRQELATLNAYLA
jgi:hypothetical protein